MKYCRISGRELSSETLVTDFCHDSPSTDRFRLKLVQVNWYFLGETAVNFVNLVLCDILAQKFILLFIVARAM